MMRNKDKRHVRREPTEKREDANEFTMLSFNVRGLNSEAKQRIVYDLLKQNRPQLVCLNETKLQCPLYLQGFWSHQSLAQRNGGVWTAARTNTRLSLVKALGTYLCWTQYQLGSTYVQVMNCYLEPGEQPHLKERAKRITDIVKDIIRQDPNAPIVLCGDFNNHMTFVVEQLAQLNFTAAL